MKNIFATAALIVFGVALAAAQPKLRVLEGMSPDFGEVHTNAKLHKVLHLVNEGNDTLVISGVSASCGCTSALASSDHIPPKGKGQINITFDPERFSGKQSKAISFDANDPRMPHAHVEFTVDIKKVLTMETEYLTYPSAHVDSQSMQELVIKNVSDTPVKILSISPSSPFVFVRPEKATIEPGQDLTLQCVLKAKSKGILRGDINIDTDNILVPKLSTRFFALVK